MTGSKAKTWKYALAQHPMWLLIAEDTVCAERTPPWGCASLEDYAERLGMGLDALDKFPRLHVNFDFSAVELEDMAQRFPDLMRRLKDLTSRGRVSFVNGTYSQPHLQILSVESAIRQLQYGLESIKRLTGYTVTSYAAQEPGFSPQLPQILRALGFVTATTPDFPIGIRLERGRVQHWNQRWEWLAGDDLINWRALDGTTIPTWLKTAHRPDDRALADEAQHGLLGHSRLRVDMPDMMEVTAEWMEKVEKPALDAGQVCEYIQLDQALAELMREYPPEAIGEIDANYAYTEGADAEDLSRANTRAETALLSLEALEGFLADGGAFDFDTAWKTILKAQHHDAYWIGGPELRAHSIDWLDGVTKSAGDRISRLAAAQARRLPEAKSPAILTLHPYARSHSAPVTLSLPRADASLADACGAQRPAQIEAKSDGSARITFIAKSQGLGYQTYFLTPGKRQARPTEAALTKPFKFANRFYSATVSPRGVVTSLACGEKSLLKKAGLSGGNVWMRQETGESVLPEALPGARLLRGPVFDLVEAPCRMGAARMTTRLSFYHELPWFCVDTDLEFEEPTELGDYFDDPTKLHYAWPVGAEARIRHAVGGCPTDARRGRSFLVYPWVDVGPAGGGLSFCLFNATKCWLDEAGGLRFLVAWGHNGARFHNRQGPFGNAVGSLGWFKPMDLRLRGKRTVKYAVRPHAGESGVGEIADWAAALLMPPMAFSVQTGGGEASLSEAFLSVRNPGVVPLSVRPTGKGAVVARLMETDGAKRRLRLDTAREWRLAEMRNLDGSRATAVGAHKIVEAKLTR